MMKLTKCQYVSLKYDSLVNLLYKWKQRPVQIVELTCFKCTVIACNETLLSLNYLLHKLCLTIGWFLTPSLIRRNKGQLRYWFMPKWTYFNYTVIVCNETHQVSSPSPQNTSHNRMVPYSISYTKGQLRQWFMLELTYFNCAVIVYN